MKYTKIYYVPVYSCMYDQLHHTCIFIVEPALSCTSTMYVLAVELYISCTSYYLYGYGLSVVSARTYTQSSVTGEQINSAGGQFDVMSSASVQDYTV